MHVMWHYANWKLWGKTEDLCAWRGLSGRIGKEEIIETMQSEGRRRGVETNKRNGTGLYDPRVREMSRGLGHLTNLKRDSDYLLKMNQKSVEVWTGSNHTPETIQKLKDAKPKGVYSNKGRTLESRLMITMTHFDGRVETRPNWEWREQNVRYDRAGIGRSHSQGWRFPTCPLDQALKNLPTE